jgi:hypothetical protein
MHVQHGVFHMSTMSSMLARARHIQHAGWIVQAVIRDRELEIDRREDLERSMATKMGAQASDVTLNTEAPQRYGHCIDHCRPPQPKSHLFNPSHCPNPSHQPVALFQPVALSQPVAPFQPVAFFQLVALFVSSFWYRELPSIAVCPQMIFAPLT